MTRTQQLCEDFEQRLNAVCRTRVEVTARGPDRWTLSGPPEQVRRAGKWLVDNRIWRPDGEPVEEDGERYEYFATRPGA